jgi:glycosyltransferase involved in cell wall biosynthesis
MPAQREVALRAGARVLELSLFEPPSDGELKILFRKSRAWFLPCGSVTQGALEFVAKLEAFSRARGLGPRPPLIVATSGEGAKGSLFLTGHRSILRCGDRVLVACEAEAALLRRSFPRGLDIEVVPLPVVTPRERPTSSRVFQKTSTRLITGWSPRLLYAGRLSEQKNVHLLLEAFARVRSVHPRAELRIAGGVDGLGSPHFGRGPRENYATWLAQRTAQLGLSRSVQYLGAVSQRELLRLHRRCDLQVSLTTHFGEDFGYAIAQGVCAGAPAVVTAWGGGLDFIRAGAALGVPVHFGASGPEVRVEEAAEVMLRALEPSMRQTLRRSALTLADRALRTDSARVIARWKRLLRVPASPNEHAVVVSPEALRFYRKQRAHWKKGRPLFAGEHDRAYRRICRAYLGAY